MPEIDFDPNVERAIARYVADTLAAAVDYYVSSPPAVRLRIETAIVHVMPIADGHELVVALGNIALRRAEEGRT